MRWSCSASQPSRDRGHRAAVAVFWMADEHGPDAKILAVPARDPRYEQLRDLADVPPHLLAEISHFFDVYKELEPGKDTDVRGWQDRGAAEREITAAQQRGKARHQPVRTDDVRNQGRQAARGAAPSRLPRYRRSGGRRCRTATSPPKPGPGM